MTTAPFTEVLHDEVAQLQAKHPLLKGALDKAFALVADGGVFPLDDGTSAHVRSQRDPAVSYLVNGSCDCASAQYRTEPCAHRFAFRLYQRVCERLTVDPEEERWEPAWAPEAPAPVPGIDPRHLVTIQGKPFVKFAGLLEMAHQRGLQELRVTWIYNDAELSLAHAVAVFPFGMFEESGDATPANVNTKVAPHFRRWALTRASARCLRLALGLDMVAVEELEGE